MTFKCPDCGKELLANVKDYASRAESRRIEMLLVERHKERGNCKSIGTLSVPDEMETRRIMAELRGEI